MQDGPAGCSDMSDAARAVYMSVSQVACCDEMCARIHANVDGCGVFHQYGCGYDCGCSSHAYEVLTGLSAPTVLRFLLLSAYLIQGVQRRSHLEHWFRSYSLLDHQEVRR